MERDTRVLQFRSRGLGIDGGAPCFVCGAECPRGDNIAAFVAGKSGGEEVTELFRDCGSAGWLDYSPSEPNWVQFKVLACEEHVPNLRKLHDLTRPDSLITSGRRMAALFGD